MPGASRPCAHFAQVTYGGAIVDGAYASLHEMLRATFELPGLERLDRAHYCYIGAKWCLVVTVHLLL